MSRGYAALGLYRPRYGANVGGVMRAAHCYGARLVVIEGYDRIQQSSDTMKYWRHNPVLQVEDIMEAVPYDAVPVAVELVDGAISLPDFSHPERAFYLLGPENGSLPDHIIGACSCVVQVPTRNCMNLAATANVVLYDRMSKRGSPF